MAEGIVPVLVASGSPAFGQGLADFLSEPPLTPVVVHSTVAALAAARERTPAVAVVDNRLADGPGIELAEELRRLHPGIRVVMAVQDPGPQAQLEALAAGASGCVVSSWGRDLVCEAVADALRGVSRFDVDVVRSLADLARRGGGGGDAALTDQERVVLRLMRQHLTYKEIARELGLSWHTVRTHAQSILRKSGVHSRRDLQSWEAGASGPVSVS